MSNTAHRQQPAPGAKTLGPDPFSPLSGMLDDVGAINARLAEITSRCHLISPSPSCVALKPGCVVMFQLVRIDPASRDVYPVQGGLGLHRHALWRLANTAGIVFPVSYRVDAQTHPHYCRWHVDGAWMDLDGTWKPVPGDSQLDLRDGSASAQKTLDEGRDAATGERNLLHKRAKIQELTETAAKLRAIRDVLTLRSYSKEELETKPFIVAKLVYTGHDDNPAIELENKRAIRAQMLGGIRGLYADPMQRPVAALAPTRASPQLPPVGSVPDEDALDVEDLSQAEPRLCEGCGTADGVVTVDSADGHPIHHCGAPRCIELARANGAREPAASAPQASYPVAQQPDPTPAARAPGARPPAADRPSPASAAGAAGRSSADVIVPFGRSKGSRLGDVDLKDLQWLRGALARMVDDPGKSRFRADNQRRLDAVIAEQQRRDGPHNDFEAAGRTGAGDDDIPF